MRAGQNILINGASGNVGSVAVQLAKQMGAIVTAVASARNAKLVADLGADHVIDYDREDFTCHVGRYDVIFDAVGKSSFGRAKRALTPTGVYMTTVPSLGIVWPTLWSRWGKGKRGLLATTGLRKSADKIRDLDVLRDMMTAGTLRCLVDRTYPLEAIAEAHAYVETERKRGSVVIRIAA